MRAHCLNRDPEIRESGRKIMVSASVIILLVSITKLMTTEMVKQTEHINEGIAKSSFTWRSEETPTKIPSHPLLSVTYKKDFKRIKYI